MRTSASGRCARSTGGSSRPGASREPCSASCCRCARSRGMLKQLLTLAVLVLVLIAAGFGANVWLARAFVAPGPMQQPLRVQVEQGMSARAVLGLLQKEGALRNARLTELYLRLRGRRLGIKAGEYEIPARASAAEI